MILLLGTVVLDGKHCTVGLTENRYLRQLALSHSTANK